MNEKPAVDLFYSGVMLVCAAMVTFNMFSYKHRGIGAYIRAAAFLTFGILAWMLQQNRPVWQYSIFAGITVILMILDLVVKVRKETGGNRP